MSTTEALRIPRIELHTHLDASLRVATIADLAARYGCAYDQPIEELAVLGPDCDSLVRFLRSIDVELDVLQHVDSLERAGRELVEQWTADGVVHGEVRFAPQFHLRSGLDLDGVVDAVHRGLAAGTAGTTMTTALIVCVSRHQPPEIGIGIAELAVRRRDVIDALDLSGAEEGFPASDHRRAFEIARDAGVPTTIHAGEAAGPDSVREALALGTRRIGHGVRSIQDPTLVAELARTGITLEIAPRCNVVTAAVESLATHPADALMRAGVAVTMNTDARTCIDTTLDQEFAAMTDTFGWGRDEERECQRTAARAAFVSEARRNELLELVDAPTT